MAPLAATIVVVARAVVVVVVDALSSPASFNGVPDVAIRPEAALDRRHCGLDFFSTSLLLGRRWIQAAGGWCSSPSTLRALTRGRALRLLRHCYFEKRLQLPTHTSLLGGCGLRAAAQQYRGG
jgi:hypothetical protein